MKLVNLTPGIARVTSNSNISALVQNLIAFGASVYTEFAAHARRLNGAITADGETPMRMPLSLASYTVATLPDATIYESAIIYVSNETGGKTIAFSDGTNWRRVQDRVIVS